LLNVRTISTRDLAHRASEVRKLLDAGQPLQWATRGQLIARLEPAGRTGARTDRDWIARATKAGAVNRKAQTLAQDLYEARG
jgi:antitoxin (DNA-binding transcriptional repressor) of toxin-antitoxin stability system